MASDTATVTYICDQMQGAGLITHRKMFGEYAVYCDGKVVALVCDNQLFLRPTPGAVALLPDAELAPPYPGGKPHILLGDGLEDRDLLRAVVAQIAREVVAPKPRKPKAKA